MSQDQGAVPDEARLAAVSAVIETLLSVAASGRRGADSDAVLVADAALAAAVPLCQADELNTWIASIRASAAGLEAAGSEQAATALKILARQMRARYAELRSSVAAQTEETR